MSRDSKNLRIVENGSQKANQRSWVQKQRKRKKCAQRMGIINTTNEFRKAYTGTGTNRVPRMRVVPGGVWGLKPLAWHQRKVLRRQVASARRTTPRANNLEIEHELACATTCVWAQAVWTVL